MKLTKRYIENESAKMFAKAIGIASAKKDGARHIVSVILSDWSDYLFGHRISQNQWLSAVVDDERVLGGKLGVGDQETLYSCTVYAPRENKE